MESNKQEKSNLLKDNPVAKMASGGSWMSKHVSPISMGQSMAPKMEKGSAAYMKDEDFKGKKPDANKNGVPDYAEDGKGKS